MRKLDPVHGQARRHVIAFLLPYWKWYGFDASDRINFLSQLLVHQLLDISHDTNVGVEIMVLFNGLPREVTNKAAIN